MNVTKYLAAAAAVCVAGSLAWGAGVFQTYPIIGGAAYCASTNVSGTAQTGPTGQGGGAAGAGVVTGVVICGQTVPAGPPSLTGTEVFPVDLYTPGTAQIAGGPATADLPITALGGAYGGIQLFSTTGTTASVPVNNGIASFVYTGAGAATFTSFVLPAAPIGNQALCLINDGTGAITLTAVAVAAGSGQSIVNGAAAPTNVAVTTANTAAAASPKVCWQYNLANTTWYRSGF